MVPAPISKVFSALSCPMHLLRLPPDFGFEEHWHLVGRQTICICHKTRQLSQQVKNTTNENNSTKNKTTGDAGKFKSNNMRSLDDYTNNFYNSRNANKL